MMSLFIAGEDKYYYYVLDNIKSRNFLKRIGVKFNVDGSYLVVDKEKLKGGVNYE